jgi:hypothetical protein
MDVAGMPAERVACYPRNRAHADRRQSDYLLQLLDQICRRMDNRIDRYLRATTIFDGCSDVDYARTFRRLRFLEEQDRQILAGLIDELRRRLSPRAPG